MSKVCVINNTLAIMSEQKLTQYAGLDEYGNPIFNVVDYISTAYKYCDNGCSQTLNDCRLNAFWDSVAFALFVFVSGCVLFFARKLGPVGVIAAVAIMLLSVLNLTWDVFAVNSLLVRLFSIAVIVFGAIMLYSAYEEGEME